MPNRFNVGDKLEIEIESLSYHGGRGVGRCEGMVVFVPWTAPGDRVRVSVTENKNTFLTADLVEILHPSAHRREAPCPVFGRCGGCSWQHVSYEEQLKQKQIILEASLKKLRGQMSFELLPIIPSPNEFHYRNRIQVNKRGREVGFFARGSRDIVNIDACPISEDEVSERISSLRSAEDGRYEISRRMDGSVEASRFRRDPETALFSQVNSGQNENLIRKVIEWAGAFQPAAIWDLYCGSGNLSFPLAAAFPKVPLEAVELSRDAIHIAQKAPSPIRWHAMDAGKFLRSKDKTRDLLIVLDPPRTGADQATVSGLGKVQPNWIIYVSCNPMTFARDALRLSELGFAVSRLQGFDMFPQTEHVELMALFTRR